MNFYSNFYENYYILYFVYCILTKLIILKNLQLAFQMKNSTLKNCYQIVLNKESTLKKFIGNIDLQYTIKRNLTEIKNIPNLSENEIISKMNYIISQYKINIK